MHPFLLLASIAAVLVILVFAGFAFRKGRPIDYYGVFVVGIVWALVGIVMNNFAVALLGLIFLFSGIIHKSRWKKDPLSWDDLKRKEKVRRVTVLAIGLLLLLAILFALFFLRWQFEIPPAEMLRLGR